MPGPFDAYDDIIDRAQSMENPRLKGSLYTAADTNPEEEAGLHRLANKTGLPVESLRVDKGAEARRLESARKAAGLETAPAAAEFLSEPANAAIAHDDVDSLKEIERIARSGFGPRGSVVSTLEFGSKEDRAAGKTAKEVVAAIMGGLKASAPSFNAGLAETGRIASEATGWGPALRGLSDLTGSEVFQNIADAPRLAELFWNSVAEENREKTKAGTLPYYLGQASESLGVSLMAAPFGLAGEGAALGMFGISAPGGQEELTAAGYSEPTAALVSVPKKIMEGLTEKIGLDALYAGGKPVVKQMTEFIFKDLLGEEINTLYGAIADKVTIKPNMTWHDLGQEVVDTAIITVLQGGMQGGAFHGAAKGADFLQGAFEESRRTRSAVQVMTALGEKTQESKTFQRMPDKLRDLVSRITKDGPVENVYVSADALRELFQGSPEDLEGMLDDPDSYYQALSSGGDVIIPLPEYVEKWAGSEYHQALVKDIRLHPGDMTQRELEEWSGKMPEDFDSVLKDLGTQEKQTEGSRKVQEAVLGELLGLGRDRSTAEKEALLWGARYRTRAERMGRDAWELYQETGPVRVRRPVPEFMTRRDFVDTSVDPFLDRLRAGDIPAESDAFGPSLLDFFREKGLKDFSGELASLGIDEGRKPFQKNISREDGLELDKARESAVESGYLPAEATVADFLDALDKELRGAPVYSTQAEDAGAAGLRTDLEDFQRYLDGIGVDVSTMSNEEIRKVMKEGTQAFAQGAVDTKSEAFRAWFNGSKVVDENGEPLVVYHGTGKSFDSFDDKNNGSQTDTGMYGKGFYFTENSDYAGRYARGEKPNILPVYLKIENPLVIAKKEDIPSIPEPVTLEEMSKADVLYSEKMREILIAQGYDGVISHLGGEKEFVAFSPEQIKSVFNRGTFGSRPLAFDGQADPFFAEVIPNSLIGDASFLRNFTETRTFKEFGISGFDIPSRRVVGEAVFRVLQNPKIREAVIPLITVDVMDSLSRKELSPDVLFDDMTMFADLFTSNGDNAISLPVKTALESAQVITVLTAENISDLPRGSANDRFATRLTGEDSGRALGGEIAGVGAENEPKNLGGKSSDVGTTRNADIGLQEKASGQEYALRYDERTRLSTIEKFDPTNPNILFQSAVDKRIATLRMYDKVRSELYGGTVNEKTSINLPRTDESSDEVQGGHERSRRDQARDIFDSPGFGNEALRLGVEAKELLNLVSTGKQTKPEVVSAFAKTLSAVAKESPSSYQAILDTADALRKLGHEIPTKIDRSFSEHLLEAVAEELSLVDPGGKAMTLFQSAYHGSPHIFDEFKLQHIGSGEGAAAYGWGLYFAGAKDVAEWYRDKLSGMQSTLIIDGNKFDNSQQTYSRLADVDRLIADAYSGIGKGYKSQKQIVAELKSRAKGAFKNWKPIFKEAITKAQTDAVKVETEKGRLYHVELTPEEDEYLDWNKPLSGQSKKVKEALKLAGVTKRYNDNLDNFASPHETRNRQFKRGDSIYEFLSWEQGGAEQASKYLNSIGIHGLKYEADQIAGGKHKKSSNYVLFDDSLVTITKYEQTFAEGKRGSITFGPMFRDVALLEKADLSTFIHESGHAWLEELRQDAGVADAPDQVKDDLRTLESWWKSRAQEIAKDAGVENGDVIRFITEKTTGDVEKDKAVNVAIHEYFADATYNYLMEGKAPSVELRLAFQRFKAWLLDLFQQMKIRKIELTDDVRAIFDRLLSTDEEIKRAEEMQGYTALFTDAAAASMTEREFSVYRSTAEKAHDESESRLRVKLMKEIKREHESWWKELKSQVREEVEAEAKQNPVLQAFQVLTTGTDFDGNTVEEGFKISKAALVERYGKEFVKNLPRAFRYIYAKEGGYHPDAIAEIFGFSSGDEMIRRMANTPPMKTFVNTETDLRMRERHPTAQEDGSIADEALKAIHSDYQGQVLRAELRALRRKQREVAPFVKVAKSEKDEVIEQERREREYERRWMDAEKKLAVAIERGARTEEVRALREEIRANREEGRKARLAMEAGIPPIEAFKLWAAQAIGAKSIRLIQPGVYSRAEQAAGKKAFELASKGKFEEAGSEKQKQLLNHYLYIEAVKAKEDADKVYDYAKRLQKDATQKRIGKAGGDYLDQINGLLERYEFKKQTLETLAKRRSLMEWAKEQDEMGLAAVIPEEILVDAGKRNYKEMTIDELRAVRDALKNIEHLSTISRKLLGELADMEKEEAIAELVASAVANYDPKKIPLDKETRSWIEKRGENISLLDASLIKIEQLVEWLDGGAIDGPWARMIFRPIAAAESKEHDLTLEYTVKVAGIFEDYSQANRLELLDRYGEKLRAFPEGLAQGKGVLGKIDKAIDATSRAGSRLMEKVFIPSIGESITRQAAIAAALNMGNESNQRKLLKGYEARGWTEETINEILSHLDESDARFVGRVWEVINEFWPEIEAMEKRLSGIAPPKIEARQITIAGVHLDGGYYPVINDPRFSAAGEKQADAKGDRLFDSTYVRATTEKGHTKARIEQAASPILLNLEVIPQHIAQVIHDLTHREAVISADMLLNSKEIREALNSTIGAPYYKQMKLWLANVANDRNIDRTGVEFWTKFLSALRTNATIVGMGFRVTTMIAQVAGLSQSLDIVKGKHLAAAVRKFARHPMETAAWVAEKSGEMRHRRNSLDRDIRDGVRKLMGKHGAKAWIQGKAFAGIGYMDAVVSIPTWLGAYEQAKAENLSEADAIAAGDRAVRLSQGSGGAKDLAAVQRSNDVMKMFTMFYSYFSVLYNRLRNMGRLKSIDEITFLDVAWKSFVMVMVPAIMTELIVGRGPDDDEDAAWWALKKILGYPFMTVPFLRDMVNAWEGGRDYQLTPISRALEMAAKLPRQIEKVADGEKDLSDLIFQSFDLPGYAFGLPTGQVRSTSKYLWDLWDGDLQAEDIGDVLKGILFGHKKGGKR